MGAYVTQNLAIGAAHWVYLAGAPRQSDSHAHEPHVRVCEAVRFAWAQAGSGVHRPTTGAAGAPRLRGAGFTSRKRGVTRFLHCSTESILVGPSSSEAVVTERTSAALDDMPGAYTRSKMRAEQAALAAARSGFPVVIANPTMPTGPHHGNLTPPALMLQHFARRRMQIYLDCRRGPAPRHGPRRGQAALYSRWRAHPVAASRYGGSDL